MFKNGMIFIAETSMSKAMGIIVKSYRKFYSIKWITRKSKNSNSLFPSYDPLITLSEKQIQKFVDKGWWNFIS